MDLDLSLGQDYLLSWLCVKFVGWSPLHELSVAWVRNLQTGRISPQFHVVSDNWFEAVELNDETETPPEWDVIATWSTFVSNADQKTTEVTS